LHPARHPGSRVRWHADLADLVVADLPVQCPADPRPAGAWA